MEWVTIMFGWFCQTKRAKIETKKAKTKEEEIGGGEINREKYGQRRDETREFCH